MKKRHGRTKIIKLGNVEMRVGVKSKIYRGGSEPTGAHILEEVVTFMRLDPKLRNAFPSIRIIHDPHDPELWK